MKSYFLIIVLGVFLIFIFAGTMFNYNLIANMLNKQDLIQANVDNLKKESEIVAYNLGELIDVGITSNEAVNKNSEFISGQNSNQKSTMTEMMAGDESEEVMGGMDSMGVPMKNDENTGMPKVDSSNDVRLETISSILSKSPNIELKGINGAIAIGKAAMGVYENKTYLKVAVINMPNLPSGHEFKVWLIDNDKIDDNKISAGTMNYEASTSNATLFFVAEGDKSGYRKVLITLDSKEGITPSTSFPVIEGSFGDDVDFNVVLEMPSSKPKDMHGQIMNNLSEDQSLESLLEALKGGNSSTLQSSGFDMAGIKGINNMNMQDLLKTLGK